MLLPTTSPVALPTPSSAAQEVSAALARVIHAEIDAAGGSIDFARFMELALYAPGLGYYSAGSTKLGAAGDFVTAPELSAALGRAFALTIDAELAALGADTVLEVGAGTGVLAAQLLDAFTALGRDVRYLILERSADLRARQQETLAGYAGRVRWLDELPREPIAAVVVANEVLDALPVTCFVKMPDGARAVGVRRSGDGFAWGEPHADAGVASAAAALEHKLGVALPSGYRSEFCPALPAWLSALGASLERGALLFADYGLVRTEYYHEQRAGGTLVCHYRHRAHDDPFVYPGLQDITAWVDFSACAEAAEAAGLTVAGFTTQGHYLLETLAQAPHWVAALAASPREQSAFKTLVLPGEMGERFKVLLLRKGSVGPALPGRDLRHRL
jgi:SAM-dependent MidA family methyltransferase